MKNNICTKCNIRPAANTSGLRRCTECHYKNSQKIVPCKECGTYFKTSNNSHRCSSCSYKRRKKLVDRKCSHCNNLIDPRSRYCAHCRAGSQDRRILPIGTKRLHKTSGYTEIKTSKGWLRDHTAVMEEHLGRKLFPGETVHHKNGQRSDNHIKNLELWTRNQPAGQRVEDLIAWAKEILTLYNVAT